jgi:hypothetical protein
MKTNNAKLPTLIVAPALLALLATLNAGVSTARADCPTIDFENLAANTPVTNQYSDVTISVLPQSCPQPLYMRIHVPPKGTSSGTKCIKIDTGCPDFSDEYLRMVFANLQREVSFTLGDWTATYTVRYYSTTSGAGLLGSFTVTLPPTGGGDVGVHRRVTVTSATRNIRRIEVQADMSSFEAIDDLTYNVDDTAPFAEITSPAPLACFCSGSAVIGSAYDVDGPITRWQLHRKELGAASWVLVTSSTTERTNSTLANWTPSGGDGYYTLRLTVENTCGLETVVTTDVYVNKAFNSLSLRSPVNGSVLGGSLCADGTAWDHCAGTIALESRPAGGGAWQPFGSVSAPWVITDGLGSWNTRAVADGNYLIRLIGTDDCDNAATNQVTVTVDNTAPTAVITAPTGCSARSGVIPILGTTTDAHLLNWVLQYTGDNVHGWVTIANNNVPVINGLLANWNTAGLPPCAYTLRLVVTDQAVLDCNGALHNQSEYTVSLNLVSDPLAVDTDADGMPDIWETAHGFNSNDPADAALDADNDGQTNLAEYRAGTDPRNPGSVLRITAIAREVNDARVTWNTVGSHHYLLQGSTILAEPLSNNVSPLISVPPGGESTTNFLQLNGATLPSRFYRVRLVD